METAEESHREDTLLLNKDSPSEDPQNDPEEESDKDEETLSNNWQAGWNIINGQQGAALLGAPYAVALGGFWALIPLLLIALIANYTSKILVACLFEKNKDENENEQHMVRHSYMEVAEASFKYTGWIVRFAVFASSFSIAVLYLQTIAAILEDMLRDIIPSVPRAGLLGVVIVPSLAFVFISSLSRIATLSFWALVSLVLLTFSVCYYSIRRSSDWHADELLPFNFMDLMHSTSIIVFNFSAQFFIVDVFKSMKQPSSFKVVLNFSTAASALLFFLIAISACLAFGRNLNEFVNLSLPPGTLRFVVNITFALKSFLSFPFAISLCEIYFPRFSLPESTMCDLTYWVGCLRRAFFTLCSFVAAILLPSYSFVLYFTGGIIMVFTEIIFPALFHLKLKLSSLSSIERIVDVTLIVYGVFIGVATVSYALKDLWNTLTSS